MFSTACRDGVEFDLPITMAFQPSVDVHTETAFAYEALVRGQNGRGAADVLGQVSADNRSAFDQLCRTTAIEHASGGLKLCSGSSAGVDLVELGPPPSGHRLTFIATHRVPTIGTGPRIPASRQS